MAKTLKERYENKRLTNVKERAHRAETRLVNEAKAVRLIVEAMDEEDLSKVSQVIDKLRTMKGKGLQSLDAAIEQAEAELNKYTGGGAISKAWGKLKAKVGVDNPVVKIMTMADALEQGFKQLPVILKNNIGDSESLKSQADKSIDDIVTDEGKKKTLIANIVKALTPKGIFGSFKNLPYLDREMFATDISATKLSALAPIIKAGTSGTSPQEVASDLKDTAIAGGEAQTKGSSGSEPSKETSKSTGTAPGVPTTGTTGSVGTGETPGGEVRGGGTPSKGGPAKKLNDEHVKAMAQDFAKKSGVDVESTYKVMAALNQNEKLKESFIRNLK